MRAINNKTSCAIDSVVFQMQSKTVLDVIIGDKCLFMFSVASFAKCIEFITFQAFPIISNNMTESKFRFVWTPPFNA